jgi:hypothetical protein
MSVNFHKLSERLIAEQQPINIHRALNLNPPRDAVCGGDITALDIPARLSLSPDDQDALRMHARYPVKIPALQARFHSVSIDLRLIGME